MGKRTSKKDEKIRKSVMKILEPWIKRNEVYVPLNRQEYIMNVIPLEEDDDHIPIEDIRAMYPSRLRPHCDHIPPGYTGRCSICELLLTTKYTEDFPTEWKICCFCLKIAKVCTEHEITFYNWETSRVQKIKKLINLVG